MHILLWMGFILVLEHRPERVTLCIIKSVLIHPTAKLPKIWSGILDKSMPGALHGMCGLHSWIDLMWEELSQRVVRAHVENHAQNCKISRRYTHRKDLRMCPNTTYRSMHGVFMLYPVVL